MLPKAFCSKERHSQQKSDTNKRHGALSKK